MRYNKNDNTLDLETGKSLYCYGGVLGMGVAGKLEARYGWDGDLTDCILVDETITSEDRIEIADAMIARWTKWRDAPP